MDHPYSSGDQKPYILYADDDEDDRNLLSLMFNKVAPDYEVITVKCGTELLDTLKKMERRLPCLVIVDMNMPGLTGREIIESLKAEKKFSNLPLIIFTTSANPTEQSLCETSGIHMITKPSSLIQMEAVARQFISFCNSQVNSGEVE